MRDTAVRNFTDLLAPGQRLPVFIIVYVMAFGLSAVVGSIGNILVIFAVINDRKLRKIKNSFIICLAVADFWVSAITMPASISGVILGREWFTEHHAVCALTSAVCAPACIASVYSMSWIAAHRYYYIGEFSNCVKHFTLPRIILYVAITWLFSFSIHVPNHLGWGEIRYSFILRFCSIDTDHMSYAAFYAALVATALVIAFVFYVRIYRLVRSSSLAKRLIVRTKKKSKTSIGASWLRRLSAAKISCDGRVKGDDPRRTVRALMRDLQRISGETKIITVSFRIYMIFLLSWLPLTVLFFWQPGDRLPPWVYLLAGLLAHCNSTLNFLLYFWMDGTFRASLWRLVRDWGALIGFAAGKNRSNSLDRRRRNVCGGDTTASSPWKSCVSSMVRSKATSEKPKYDSSAGLSSAYEKHVIKQERFSEHECEHEDQESVGKSEATVYL